MYGKIHNVVVVCTDLSGKEPHTDIRDIRDSRMATSGNLDSEMVCTLAQTARGMG